MDDKLQSLFDEMKLVYASKLTDEVKSLNTEIAVLKAENGALKTNHVTLESENRMLRESCKRKDDNILASEEKNSAQFNELAILKRKYGQLVKDTREYQANAKAIQDTLIAAVSQSKAMSSTWDKCRQRLQSADDLLAGPANGPATLKNMMQIVDLDDADDSVSAQDETNKIKIRIVSDNGKLISVPQHAGTGRTKDGAKIEPKTEIMPNKRNRRSISAAAEGAFLCSENGCGRTFKRKCILQDHVRESHYLRNQ